MRLLMLTATAIIAVPCLGSAQSVLERVLGQIDGASNLAQVNGVYANIAESVTDYIVTPGSSEDFLVTDAPESFEAFTVTFLNFEGAGIGYSVPITIADAGSTNTYRAQVTPYIWYETQITFSNDLQITDFQIVDASSDVWFDAGFQISGGFSSFTDTLPFDPRPYVSESLLDAGYTYAIESQVVETIVTPISHVIDGSITNIITGVTSATQEAVAGTATATEFTLPTLDLGDMATTALGAVNTGEITLGVNSAVDEASTSTTNAISAVMTQIGGSADTGALVLNVASNASAVNGSINNTMAEVNGSIGNLSTTALGAVNTGTITSGVDAAVAGIVGMSGQ
ncbi:hypothetical protein [Sulfitobacter sp.]|uniref:hypothetical protein n=1 Tax=Sulfitobacter sp. TaxID=1903071 RepID=UPI003F6B164F